MLANVPISMKRRNASRKTPTGLVGSISGILLLVLANARASLIVQRDKFLMRTRVCKYSKKPVPYGYIQFFVSPPKKALDFQ